jgi:hypothetical protein
LVFKALNLKADRRLRASQPLPGAREAFCFSDGHETTQQIKIKISGGMHVI